jgi:hypothetical protein
MGRSDILNVSSIWVASLSNENAIGLFEGRMEPGMTGTYVNGMDSDGARNGAVPDLTFKVVIRMEIG